MIDSYELEVAIWLIKNVYQGMHGTLFLPPLKWITDNWFSFQIYLNGKDIVILQLQYKSCDRNDSYTTI